MHAKSRLVNIQLKLLCAWFEVIAVVGRWMVVPKGAGIQFFESISSTREGDSEKRRSRRIGNSEVKNLTRAKGRGTTAGVFCIPLLCFLQYCDLWTRWLIAFIAYYYFKFLRIVFFTIRIFNVLNWYHSTFIQMIHSPEFSAHPKALTTTYPFF